MPQVTMRRCQMAMDRVFNRWGKWIPDKLKQYKAEQIFIFHDNSTSFTPNFRLAYASSFMKAFGASEGDLEMYCSGAGGFCEPNEQIEKRRIHIPAKSEFDVEGLVSHEFLHWLSHPNFFPKYFTEGHATEVEGATEWLRLKCYSTEQDGFAFDDVYALPPGGSWVPTTHRRFNQCAYGDAYEKMNAWLKSSKKTNLDLLLNFVFKGIPCDLGG